MKRITLPAFPVPTFVLPMFRCARTAALLLCAATGAAHGQALLMTHAGNKGDQLGISMASAGDWNGDGIDDLIVGSSAASKARVLSGADGALLATWTAAPTFGWTVAGAGDVDGDGRDDVAVAAPLEGNGAVYVYSGMTGSLLRKVLAPVAGQWFGFALAGCGDVDGDGRAEIAIGAPGDQPFGGSPGAVYIHSPAKDAFVRVLMPGTAASGYGRSLANAGDVNGDGVADLLVGAPLSAKPAAYLHSGFSGQLLRTYAGAAHDFDFGHSVAGLGVLGPGGQMCIGVGTPSAKVDGVTVGSVRVFHAITGALLHLVHGTPDSQFGFALASGGDVDGDGWPDILVGAPSANPSLPAQAGAAYVLDGPTGSIRHTFTGVAGHGLGASVVALGSIDGDPYGEIAIGAPKTGTTAGAVFVHEGLVPCGAITKLGNGCAGTAGIVPKLDLTGCARTYSPSALTLKLTAGPHFATTALLFLGAGSGDLALHPTCALTIGTLIGAPLALPLVPAGVPIPGSGKFVATAALPALGIGATFHLQALVLDPGTPIGFSATNRVTLALIP